MTIARYAVFSKFPQYFWIDVISNLY